MSYDCYCKGGSLKAHDRDSLKKIISILKEVGIDSEEFPKGSLELAVYGSGLLKYNEEDYDEIAGLCEPHAESYLDFLGEDNYVWSLVFKNGQMNDVTGILEWRPGPPKVTVPLDDGFSLIAEQNADTDYKEIAVSLMAADGHLVQDLAMISEEYDYENNRIVPLHGQYSVKVWSDPDDKNWQTKTVIAQHDECKARCRGCGSCIAESERGKWICDNLKREIHSVSDNECEALSSHVWAEGEKTCCICGGPIVGYGNDPWPVSEEPGAKCCDTCNALKVIPARLSALRKRENKPSKRLSLDCCCMPPIDYEEVQDV